RPGQTVAGTRVVPLCVPEERVSQVEHLCQKSQRPLAQIHPFTPHKVAIVTTGNEVYCGRITDGFGPILKNKFDNWGSQIVSQTLVPDSPNETAVAINQAIEAGATLVAVTGGMSVDPDDKTPAAIKQVADEIITYGAPVYPGAMFMLAYKQQVAIMGLPGCVMYNKASIFDLIAPRILAGLRPTRHDFIGLAHGGLCEDCPDCHYPNCVFGKGSA
ncbi:MAG: molybdopterin-binding protein, partial [Candidatus Adiutrix sp.]